MDAVITSTAPLIIIELLAVLLIGALRRLFVAFARVLFCAAVWMVLQLVPLKRAVLVMRAVLREQFLGRLTGTQMRLARR